MEVTGVWWNSMPHSLFQHLTMALVAGDPGMNKHGSGLKGLSLLAKMDTLTWLQEVVRMVPLRPEGWSS